MLSLALRGKLAITEDVLTAALFDALADHNDMALLRAILADAHPQGSAIALADDDQLSVELWPRTVAGEPDVRITVHRAMNHIATILIEAKLWAPKSGTGDVADDGSSGDQLARYLLAESSASPRTYLLYLTHHASLPNDDLAESKTHLRAKGRDDLVGCLCWSSWRAVERLLARSDDRGYARVRELLRRARMYWFDGFHLHPAPPISLRRWSYVTNPIAYAWGPWTSPGPSTWRYQSTGGGFSWPGALPRLGSSRFYGGAR